MEYRERDRQTNRERDDVSASLEILVSNTYLNQAQRFTNFFRERTFVGRLALQNDGVNK